MLNQALADHFRSRQLPYGRSHQESLQNQPEPNQHSAACRPRQFCQQQSGRQRHPAAAAAPAQCQPGNDRNQFNSRQPALAARAARPRHHPTPGRFPCHADTIPDQPQKTAKAGTGQNAEDRNKDRSHRVRQGGIPLTAQLPFSIRARLSFTRAGLALP
jgi:hypothetical protein